MDRLQKVMAHAGIASRRKCESLITEGRVSVNGQTVRELGTQVSSKDRIEVDGVPIYREEPRYILINKPRHVISAVSDDKNRQVILDYLQGIEERIYPVGRLDYDTTGLLLINSCIRAIKLIRSMWPKSKGFHLKSHLLDLKPVLC